MENVLD